MRHTTVTVYKNLKGFDTVVSLAIATFEGIFHNFSFCRQRTRLHTKKILCCNHNRELNYNAMDVLLE